MPPLLGCTTCYPILNSRILQCFFFFSFFINFANIPLHSLKYNTQRSNRRNRGLELVTNWSKEMIGIARKNCSRATQRTQEHSATAVFQSKPLHCTTDTCSFVRDLSWGRLDVPSSFPRLYFVSSSQMTFQPFATNCQSFLLFRRSLSCDRISHRSQST